LQTEIIILSLSRKNIKEMKKSEKYNLLSKD